MYTDDTNQSTNQSFHANNFKITHTVLSFWLPGHLLGITSCPFTSRIYLLHYGVHLPYEYDWSSCAAFEEFWSERRRSSLPHHAAYLAMWPPHSYSLPSGLRVSRPTAIQTATIRPLLAPLSVRRRYVRTQNAW